MGQNQGVIWNDSDFVMQYFIYSKFEEMVSGYQQTTIDPNLQLNMDQGVSISGFRKVMRSKANYKYENSMIEIPPGRISTLGLGQFQMDKHKITIKAVVGEFQKVLANNVIVKKVEDIRIKVRRDLSVKNVGQKEFDIIMKQAEQMSSTSMDVSAQVSKEREQQRLKYIEQLKQKNHETGKGN